MNEMAFYLQYNLCQGVRWVWQMVRMWGINLEMAMLGTKGSLVGVLTTHICLVMKAGIY